MAKLNLSQAAKSVGKNRVTLWRHINSGKLTAERDRDGNPLVDTSELLRVYGELKGHATGSNTPKQQQATHAYDELIKLIDILRQEQKEMKEQIELLNNRLEYKPADNPKPENDPEWPREIKSMADIILRNKIKLRYQNDNYNNE